VPYLTQENFVKMADMKIDVTIAFDEHTRKIKQLHFKTQCTSAREHKL
jgi:hypothetical protein